MNVTALAAAKGLCRSRKIESGSISAAATVLTNQKGDQPRYAQRGHRDHGDVQPSVGALMNANVIPDRNTTAASAPA